MSELVLRLADLGDIPKIKHFINTTWKRFNLINNEELFRFYFVRGEQVNFILAEDEEGTLYGTLAFIYCGEREQPDLGLTLFKTIQSPYTLLGIRMFEKLKELLDYRVCFSQNMAVNTALLHKMMGHTVEELEHWYRLSDREGYRIAIVKDKCIPEARAGDIELVPFPDAGELFRHFVPPDDLVPYKDERYIRRRYYEFPAYKYIVYGLKSRALGTVRSILVCREVPVEGETILKIVDFIGKEEDLSQLSGELQRLIRDNDYEYVEMYQYGLKEQTMREAGLVRRKRDDVNIIPTYLEPLARVNTDYMLYYSDHVDTIRLFRADCDMDRPNLEE